MSQYVNLARNIANRRRAPQPGAVAVVAGAVCVPSRRSEKSRFSPTGGLGQSARGFSQSQPAAKVFPSSTSPPATTSSCAPYSCPPPPSPPSTKALIFFGSSAFLLSIDWRVFVFFFFFFKSSLFRQYAGPYCSAQCALSGPRTSVRE